MRLLDTLRYTLGTTFPYPQNYNTWQPFGPGGAKDCSFQCKINSERYSRAENGTWPATYIQWWYHDIRPVTVTLVGKDADNAIIKHS